MNPLELAVLVGQMLEELGIEYAIGGSIASSLFGEPRSTLDIDIALRGSDDALSELVARAAVDFYVPAEAASRAITENDSFNLLHTASGIKVDLFVLGETLIDHRQIDRRVRVSLQAGDLWVTSPEDIVLRKLSWYQLAGEASERQWRDVTNLLRITEIDRTELLSVANEVGLAELLARAIAEAAD